MNHIRNILLIDSDNEVAEIFCDAVHEIDPEIICLRAADAGEASRLMFSEPTKPDLIFANSQMTISGNDYWLQEIKKDKLPWPVRVIVYADSSDPETARDIQASFHLVKPVKVSDFKEALLPLLQLIE